MKKSESLLPLILLYCGLILFSISWYEVHHLSLWVAIVVAIPLIFADIFGELNPRFLSAIYTHREKFAYTVLVISIITAIGLFIKFPTNFYSEQGKVDYIFIIITQFVFQGAIVGLTIRMLLLNLFAEVIRAKSVHKAKLLVVAAWVVFIIMFPINGQHSNLSPFFILGFGIGFYVHYFIRTQDKKNVQSNRLRENILSMLAAIKDNQVNSISVSGDDDAIILADEEEIAVNLYSSQKWQSLKKYLDSQDDSPTLFFIRISMLRKMHNYDTAISLIKDRLEEKEFSHEHFLHLHYALNESERFKRNGEWRNKDRVFHHLEEAHVSNPNCLLTCATYALRLADEIEKNETDTLKKEKALSLIWQAMKLYEDRSKPKIVSLITGMTVPVTYTFLLDTYGYVLLKCGRLRFAKALLLQCLFQDPSYSATYLHLAEWYFEYYGNNNNLSRESERWRKAAQLNLLIAIEIEKEFDQSNQGTLISKKAKKLLSQISRH